MDTPRILTIGHSNHPLERFLALLMATRVTALADVRSRPISRFAPQFNKDALARFLAENKIEYRFLGNALGGRPKFPALFTGGVADYEKMATQPEFRVGIARIIEAADRHRIVLMCSEINPLDCHRCLLIGRILAEARIEVGHVVASGGVITHQQIEDQLLATEKLTETGLLFRTREERLAAAYHSRGRKVAYSELSRRSVRDVPEINRA